MIRRTRQRLLLAGLIMIIIAAVLLTWWYYLSPSERATAPTNIKTVLISGAISGAVYALLALGFTLIFGVSRVVNLAHGGFFMLGAYMFSVIGSIEFLRLQFPALVLAAIFVGIAGIIFYRLTIHYVIGDELAILVATVGVALILQQLILLTFSNIPHSVPALMSGSVTVWGVRERYSRLLAFGASLILFGSLLLLIMKSKIGRAMRAVSQDREAAMLMGINTERLYMLTMAISASLAAVAGIFIAASTTGAASPYMWLLPLVFSFAIVILGGLGSIKGTIIGGFIVGYAETSVAELAPEGGAIVPVVPLVIMVLILLWRPKGLFGKHIEMEE